MREEIINWYKKHLGEGWYNRLEPFLTTEDMEVIRNTVNSRRKKVNVYPKASNVFKAFELCPFKDVRVVIIGQDPYHTPGYATGLAFSSGIENPLPPSLLNILKELEKDVFGLHLSLEFKHDLSSWAEQGVLLLNSALTVEKGAPGSHSKLWNPFTVRVFEALQEQTGIIYVLWGAHAKSFKLLIKDQHNYILESVHPSPLSAHRGFFGCKHFSRINEIIRKQSGPEFEIKWD